MMSRTAVPALRFQGGRRPRLCSLIMVVKVTVLLLAGNGTVSISEPRSSWIATTQSAHPS